MTTKDIVQLWSDILTIPTVKSGELSSDGVSGSWTIELADIAANTKRKYTTAFSGTTVLDLVSTVDAKLVGASTSPSRTKKVLFFSAENSISYSLFEHGRLVRTGSISDTVHGPLCPHPMFQNITWSADESTLAYMAQRASPKKGHAWENKFEKKFDTIQNFGELLKDFSFLSVFTFRWVSHDVAEAVPESFALQNALLSPVFAHYQGQDALYFVAFPYYPERLGLAHCGGRANKLFVSTDRSTNPVELSGPAPQYRCLRASRDHQRIAFFSAAPNCNAHACCNSLWTLDTATSEFKELVPIVERSDDFPGLYPVSGNDLYWRDNEHIIVNSVRFSSVVVYVVHATTGARQMCLPTIQSSLSPPQPFGTWTVLDVSERAMLLSYSTATSFPRIYLVSASGSCTLLRDYQEGVPTKSLSDPTTFRTATVTIAAPRWTESLFHYKPQEDGLPNRPLVLFVHGGPHAVDNNSFLHFVWFYLECGFNVLSVNYAGSLGFGQWSIDSLLGHIGEHDVEDCMVALDTAIAQFYHESPIVVVSGGSHGGYLGAHLTGRFPDRFKAAFLRNPVINLAAMYWETDISDWCLTEVGLKDPNVEAFYKASPIQYAGSVQAATLIGIGTEDLRVPPPQGRSWYYAIRRAHDDGSSTASSAPIVRLLEYPANSHPLDGVHASTDFHLNSMKLVQELQIIS